MRFIRLCYLFPILAGVVGMSGARAAEVSGPLVFISAFAAGDKGGIHAYQLDLKTGALKAVPGVVDVQTV